MNLETFVEGTQVVTRATCLTPYTLGSIREGDVDLEVRDASEFAALDPLYIAGAGSEGGPLKTTVASITGDTITLSAAAVATVNRVPVGKLANPGTVTFTARRGDDTPTAYQNGDPEVSNPSVGVWELRLVNDENDWLVHFQGTTPVHCAAEVAYRIRRSRALA